MSRLDDICSCGHRRGLHSVDEPYLCTKRLPSGRFCTCPRFVLDANATKLVTERK